MTDAQQGSKVKVHYTGKLDSGEVFDSSAEREPLEFTTGQGNIIAGFEKAVLGMSQGEKKTVTIPPEEAYGEHRQDRVFEVPRDNLPDEIDVEVGRQLEVRHQDGSSTIVRISEVGTDSVKLDANHPLAGEALTFEIELVEVE